MVAACLLGASEAGAATATFDSSMPYAPGPMTTLSTAGDGLGQLAPLGEWFSLLFAQPFGVSKSDTVSIFTLAPPTGNARLTISFGRYNGGSPVYADTRNVNAGNTLTINNLFQRGCAALGGCDYIFITTTRQQGGANGATDTALMAQLGRYPAALVTVAAVGSRWCSAAFRRGRAAGARGPGPRRRGAHTGRRRCRLDPRERSG